MMALYHRQATGQGQHVEAALLPTALMMSNAMLIERELLQVEKPRMANRGTSVAPCDLYEVADGWVLLQVAGQPIDRKSGGWGKSVSVRVVLGGRRILKKKNKK